MARWDPEVIETRKGKMGQVVTFALFVLRGAQEVADHSKTGKTAMQRDT